MNKSKTRSRDTRPYFLIAAILISIPSLLGYYRGHTGKLLIATNKLDGDPFFQKTVIYIFEHTFWGAKGIVINQPMINIAPSDFGVDESYATLYKGGPVGFPLVKVAAFERPRAASKWTTQPLSVFNYKRLNKDRLPDFTHNNYLNVFVGASGWRSGQLEDEIARGIWTVSSCDITILKETVPYANMWPHLSEKKQKNICE